MTYKPNGLRPDPKSEPKLKKKPQPIKKMSDKRAVENETYSLLRRAFLLRHPDCQGNFTGCTKKATTVHHSKGRLGALLCDIRYFKGLCMSCHTFAETHPEKAKELGLSVSRLDV
jgi:hypothetical protein